MARLIRFEKLVVAANSRSWQIMLCDQFKLMKLVKLIAAMHIQGKFIPVDDDKYCEKGKCMMRVNDDRYCEEVIFLVGMMEETYKILHKKLVEFEQGKSMVLVDDDMYWKKVILSGEIKEHGQKSEIIYDFPRFFSVLVMKLTTGGVVNFAFKKKEDMIIENLDFEPKIDAMMREFLDQDKYVAEILRKFGLTDGKSASTPIDNEKPLMKDPGGEDVDVHTYRSMIGSLMYVTSSRPDIMFAVCACPRF
nr:retrovirus-related Pol polyprotein from transposon TNT 1-94 [Tanacetum cinerariifolium]